MRLITPCTVLGITLFASAMVVNADDMGAALLEQECADCHDLSGPAPTTLQALWDRKGPDLFYAGNKYRREWLVAWLQKPARIRPAGMFYSHHVMQGEKGDEIDAATLIQHPTLDAQQAKSVADKLMTFTTNNTLIKPGDYQSGTISLSMGEMLFDKFRGCLACHEIEPGYGGLSGPEVYTAAHRLQDDYLISYMRNPQAWDPRSFMPNKHLSDTDLQKFVHYFHALAEEVQP